MKMFEKIDRSMIAPCGVNCKTCSAHLNSKTPCVGCRGPVDKITRESCINCSKKSCAFEKGLDYCFECQSFPCTKIKSLNKTYIKNYNIDLVQNGNNAKENMESFLADQQEKYTCKLCGGIIDQHRSTCSECEEKIDTDEI